MRPKPHGLKVQKYWEEINTFERELEERHREMEREELRQYLEAKDREASKEVLRQGGYESKGLVERRIMTSCGVITVRVRRYRRKNGQRLYPLRDICGVDGMTGSAQSLCVRFAVERSYGWSAQTLKEVRGMGVSPMRVWRVVQEEGRKEKARMEKQRRKLFEEARGDRPAEAAGRPVIIQMDGTMIATREPTERDEFGRRHMEVKLGVMFRGTVGKARRRTVKRWVYAQVADQDRFGEDWYTECSLHGLGSSERAHVVGDGASWIRNVQHAVFPTSSYTLDLYHLKERARRVLLDHQEKIFLSLAKANLPQTALKYLKGLRPSDSCHREQLEAFTRYVEENLNGMRYPPGEIHGSGVIEKMADLVVKKRMKRQGMTWSRSGANNILTLRAHTINQNFQRIALAASPG